MEFITNYHLFLKYCLFNNIFGNLDNNNFLFEETLNKVPINLSPFIISLLLSFILSFILGKIYVLKGKSLSNRKNLAYILPLLTITTTIVIAVIKSSLALSLGLVGALSIVRFRTPIKEPEELTYIFLSIAIGLGLGAEQFIATILGTVFSIGSIFLNSKINNKKDDVLCLQISNVDLDKLNDLINIIGNYSDYVDLKNLIVSNTSNENLKKRISINLVVLIKRFSSINSLIKNISDFLPESEVFISEYQ